MREFSSPALVTIADEATLTDVLDEHAAKKPAAVLFRRDIASPFAIDRVFCVAPNP